MRLKPRPLESSLTPFSVAGAAGRPYSLGPGMGGGGAGSIGRGGAIPGANLPAPPTGTTNL